MVNKEDNVLSKNLKTEEVPFFNEQKKLPKWIKDSYEVGWCFQTEEGNPIVLLFDAELIGYFTYHRKTKKKGCVLYPKPHKIQNILKVYAEDYYKKSQHFGIKTKTGRVSNSFPAPTPHDKKQKHRGKK